MPANGRWDLIRRLKVNGKGKAVPVPTVKAYGGVEVWIY